MGVCISIATNPPSTHYHCLLPAIVPHHLYQSVRDNLSPPLLLFAPEKTEEALAVLDFSFWLFVTDEKAGDLLQFVA